MGKEEQKPGIWNRGKQWLASQWKSAERAVDTLSAPYDRWQATRYLQSLIAAATPENEKPPSSGKKEEKNLIEMLNIWRYAGADLSKINVADCINRGLFNTAAWLIDNGGNIHATAKIKLPYINADDPATYECNALHLAVLRRPGLVGKILDRKEHGLDPDIPMKRQSQWFGPWVNWDAPIHMAIHLGKPPAAETAIDPEKLAEKRNIALGILQRLIDAGVDVNAYNRDMATEPKRYREEGAEEGAELKIPAKDSSLPLILALQNAWPEAAELLIQSGANPKFYDGTDNNALKYKNVLNFQMHKSLPEYQQEDTKQSTSSNNQNITEPSLFQNKLEAKKQREQASILQKPPHR